jgi:hypothetical protein
LTEKQKIFAYGDDAMEAAALVAKALLASAESTEVLGSLGNNISSQLHNDTL